VKYIWLVALREYAENARTKGFWIGILIFPAILCLAIKTVIYLETDGKPKRYFVIADFSGGWGEELRLALDDAHQEDVSEAMNAWSRRVNRPSEDPAPQEPIEDPAPPEPFEEPERFLRLVDMPEGVDVSSPESVVESLRPYLIGEEKLDYEGDQVELFALIVIEEDFRYRDNRKYQPGVQYWCKNLSDDELLDEVKAGLERRLRRHAQVESGLSQEQAVQIAGLELSTDKKDPTRARGEEEVTGIDEARQFLPIVFVYILFISILSVAQMLLNNTIEEKSNRIIEVLFSSITSTELMAGKLAGIAMIGLTMLASWIALGIGAAYVIVPADSLDEMWMVVRVIVSWQLLAPFFVYFLFGYMLYASVFLAIGSLCATIKDAQNYMGPVMMVSMVPLLTMTFIPKDPNGPIATTLSWIPPWTPFVMMNRAAASPPMFDLIGTGVLLIASVGGTLWACSRVFRSAILRTGEPPKLLELLRWLRG